MTGDPAELPAAPDRAHHARFAGVARVVADPLRFKLRLGIGEEAFADLRLARRLQDAWDVAGVAATGAAVAKSSVVAGTFFAGHGLLATLGLASATTPVGWVIAAGVAAGGAYWGVMRFFRGYSEGRVAKIPAFLNTPLDLLGASLLDLLAPLLLEVARSDGPVTAAERGAILGWLTREWGYDAQYAETALDLVAQRMTAATLEDLAAGLARFQRANPDCNPRHMRRELVGFLNELSRSDAAFDDAPAARAISRIDSALAREGQHWALRRIARLRAAAAARLAGFGPTARPSRQSGDSPRARGSGGNGPSA